MLIRRVIAVLATSVLIAGCATDGSDAGRELVAEDPAGPELPSKSDLAALAGLGEQARAWNETSLAPVQAILDENVYAEDAAAVIDDATPVLRDIYARMQAATIGIEDLPLAELIADLLANYEAKLLALESLAADWWAGGDGREALAELDRAGAEARTLSKNLAQRLAEWFGTDAVLGEEYETAKRQLEADLGIDIP